ncbi:hypothetical protein HNO88_003707 [Novosphingobium chloroacetimidivorans]|uniref:STAS domain-containing protein n=1 Tax=Novosphingobium chloroacetimidivorans TaxID=1428314 RepID=A0A7W7KDQ0_9SPHN|nr:hypothetical protein [Novosphingobium chloroacetimidivorans]
MKGASKALLPPLSIASRSGRQRQQMRGLDARKKVVGRKRHMAVHTNGRLLMLDLTKADIIDSAGAQVIVAAVRKLWP